MRRILQSLCLAALMPAAALSTSYAQTPPYQLMAGTSVSDNAQGMGGWCYVAAGPSTFLRNGALPARISFADVIFTVPNGFGLPTYYRLSGLARVRPLSGDSGTLLFDSSPDYPEDVQRPPFSNYVQTYNVEARSVSVSFDIDFDGCSVPFSAIYRF